jgi:cell division protein FtsQ
MNRRAGQKARLIYWSRRISTVVVVGCLTAYGCFYLWASGWVSQTSSRIERGFYTASADSGFRVESLVIEGRSNLDRNQLKALIDITPGDPIFATDLPDIEQKLEQVSWVKDALVERRLPDTLYINIKERDPLALWQKQGKLSVVDSEGVVLTDKNLDRFRDLPIIVGDEAPQRAPELVAMIQAEPALKARLESAKWIGGRRWDLFLKNGVAIRLPEDDQGQAIARLAKAQKNGGLMDRQIEAIDLRDPVRIVVQTKPGAVESYEASYTPDKNI